MDFIPHPHLHVLGGGAEHPRNITSEVLLHHPELGAPELLAQFSLSIRII